MEQSRVTDYFGKRRVYRSPDQKRRKMTKGMIESFKEEPKLVSSSSATPEVTLAVAAEQFTVVSERKRKGELSSRLRLGDKDSPAASGSLSATRRQLDFSKIRRQNSDESPKEKSPVRSLFTGPPSPELPQMDLDNFHFGSGKKAAVAQSVVPTSPSKLHSAVVKKKLGKVANLQQLRDRLATFSDVAVKLNQQVRDVAVVNATDSAGQLEKLDQKTKAGKLTSLSPSKEATAAFERFQHLVTPEGPQLELSATYRRLDETFDCSDTVVSLMFNRAEVVTFSKLKAGIQKMTRRNFEVKHLGQIKTVYPEAYIYELQNVRSILPEERGRAKVELTIAPNIETDLLNYKSVISAYPTTPKKEVNVESRLPPGSPVKKFLKRNPPMPKSPVKTPTKGVARDSLSANRRICRKAIFHHNLLEILKEKHREFLLTLDPPMKLEEDEESQLKRWHPKFLSTDIPDVVSADLPQVAVLDPVFSAKDFLQSAKPSTLPKEVQLALAATASKTVEPPKSPEAKKVSLPQQNTKGLPAALLKKIREKEAAKNQQAMMRNPTEEARETRLSRLPDLIRIIQAQFTTENKSALPFTAVERKLTDSYKSLMATSEVRPHIDLLKEVLPQWMSEVKVSDSGGYLKIDRKLKISDLLQQLEKSFKKRS